MSVVVATPTEMTQDRTGFLGVPSQFRRVSPSFFGAPGAGFRLVNNES